MKQEEKKPDTFVEGVLHILELIKQGKISDFKFEMNAKLINEEITKLQAENEQLKAKLETAKEALRFYTQPRRGAFLGSDSDYEFYPNHDVALDALKEIEGD